MYQLKELRDFNADGVSLDELVAFAAFGKLVKNEFEAHEVEVPEWVEDQLQTLEREITSRSADARNARVKEIESRLAALKTNEEKRKDLQEELERLKGRTTRA